MFRIVSRWSSPRVLLYRMQARPSAFEDGSFWDENPDQISTDQIVPSSSLFADADSLFLDGGLESATAAYRLLLEPFDSSNATEDTTETIRWNKPQRSEQNPVLLQSPDGVIWLFHTSNEPHKRR